MERSDWVIIGALALLMAAGVGIQLYGTIGTDLPSDFFIQKTLARAAEEGGAAFPRPPEGFWRVAWVPLSGDSSGQVGNAVENAVRGELIRGPDSAYVAEELEKDLGKGFRVQSTADAAAVGRRLGVDVVAWGEVKGLSDGPDGCEVSYHFRVVRMPVDRGAANVLAEVSVTRSLAKSVFSMEYYRLRVGETSGLFRIVLWLVIGLGLPFVLYPLELKVFDLDSNAVGAVMLGGMVALDLLAALLLNGFSFSGLWLVMYGGLLIGCGAYTVSVLNALQEAD